MNIMEHIFNIGPSLGKTKLILALAAKYAKIDKSSTIFILNTSKTLSQRDFYEAIPALDKLSISCSSVIT